MGGRIGVFSGNWWRLVGFLGLVVGGVVGNVFGGAFVEAGVGFDGAAGAGVPLILNPKTRQIE